MLSEISLTTEQKLIVDAALDHVSSPQDQCLKIGGYAGTGKTTILGVVSSYLQFKRIAWCSLTGKAASVLRQKIDLKEEDYCGTIHRLIYMPITNSSGKIIGWDRRDELDYDLVIIDEASMVPMHIYHDLASYGVTILAVGDHGQLPPVEGKGGLMDRPDYRLEKIHRQAEGNPIIKLSVAIREHGKIRDEDISGDVVRIKSKSLSESYRELYQKHDMALCATNRLRCEANRIAKSFNGTGAVPEPGDRVICLRNNHELGIFNGLCGTVDSCKQSDSFLTLPTGTKLPTLDVSIEMDDGIAYSGTILKHQFGNQKTLLDVAPKDVCDLFDFAYCMTVHKAQGSEASSVLLLEEPTPWLSEDDRRRWAYTAVTRARKNLTIVSL